MSQWEEVELMDATHVEVNGEVHEIKEKDGIVERSVDFSCIDILVGENKWANIPQEAFPLLGIRCLRKVKQTPSEFEATFVFYDGKWTTWDSLGDGLRYLILEEAKFRCVQIMEEEE
jgi:hypothetical protein